MQQRSRVIVEFLAIPPDFDIDNFLSIPESVGRFPVRGVKKDQLSIIANSIKASPVFVLSNALESVLISCINLLGIFQELGITVQTVSNIKRSTMFYKDFLESGYFLTDQDGDVQDKIIPDIVIVVVNLFPLISDNLMESALESIVKLEEVQESIKASIRKIKI